MQVVAIGILVIILALIILFLAIWYNQLPSVPKCLCGDWKDNEAVLTWHVVETADVYEVFLRTNEPFNIGKWSSVLTTVISMAKINVIVGIRYEAYVIAKNRFGSGSRSVMIQGCPRASAPEQLIFACDPIKPSISLTWNPVSCSNGYVIKRKSMTENDFRVIQTVSSPSIIQIQDTSITYGVSYTYMVVSRDPLGESAPSAPMIVCPRVPAPIHFVASTPKDRSATVLLHWQSVSDSIAYHIYRRRVNDPIDDNPTLLVTLHHSSTNSYVDQTVVNKVKYTYTIAGEDSAGVSSRLISTIGVAALAAPISLTAEPIHGNATIILSWTEVADASGYRIWRSEGSSTIEKEIGTLSHEFNTKYVDTKVTHGTTYTYTIQTFDKTTEYGPKSHPIKAVVLPVTPLTDRQKPKQDTLTRPLIDVRFGDLLTEKVDAIVVCLVSNELKNSILKAAGHSESLISSDDCRRDVNKCIVTGGGLLPCKKIIFVLWAGSSSSPDVVEQQFRNIIVTALQFAQQNQCKTVSLPALGCGGLGYDLIRVAKAMISESYKQLTTALLNEMQISFVIQHGKQNVYDEFFRQLKLQDQQTNSSGTGESMIPLTWEIKNGAYDLRRNVSKESNEGQLVLIDFRRTMTNHLDQHIVRIERIQNERWFRQYQIHKKDFDSRLQEDTEQRLYHGCADGESAVNSIIEYGFNRSLAGTQHGTAYGLGVYFSSKASESHGYTKPSNGRSAGERYMFVCRVLLGKSTHGQPSMRMCPPGFHSTTNGSSIYVIYHDTQVYAEYLIVYK